jgi:hypothetical protein
VARLLDRSAVALQREPLTQDVNKATAAEWSVILSAAGVPHDRLDDVYLATMATRDGDFPLAVTELTATWRRMNRQPEPVPASDDLFDFDAAEQAAAVWIAALSEDGFAEHFERIQGFLMAKYAVSKTAWADEVWLDTVRAILRSEFIARMRTQGETDGRSFSNHQ